MIYSIKIKRKSYPDQPILQELLALDKRMKVNISKNR